MAMLRKETHFEIHHLNEPKLLKVITLDEFIEQGLAVCGEALNSVTCCFGCQTKNGYGARICSHYQ